jgi:hypothetical protein
MTSFSPIPSQAKSPLSDCEEIDLNQPNRPNRAFEIADFLAVVGALCGTITISVAVIKVFF